MRSLTEPLAAFAKAEPIKSTIFLAVASSMHGIIVVGWGSLFDSNAPFNPCWRIYLLVKQDADTNNIAKIVKILFIILYDI